MTGQLVFWVLAALLSAACLWYLAAPLRARRAARSHGESDIAVYRDQLEELERDRARGLIDAVEAEAARAEITRRLLSADASRKADAPQRPVPARAVLAALAVGVPLVAVSLYLAVGAPGLPARPHAERLAQAPEEMSLEELVARAQAHLRANPDDVEGWRVLAPILSRMGRYEDAADAYLRLLELAGEDADTLAELGEAFVFANGGIVSDRARAVFERAARLDPDDPRPRYFLGLAALQAGRPEEARRVWQEIAAAQAPGSRWRQLVEESLAELDNPSPERAISGLPPAQRAAAIARMVDGLDERLAAQGGTAQEWLALIRSRLVLGQEDKARAVLARARAALSADEEAIATLAEGARALGLAGDSAPPPPPAGDAGPPAAPPGRPVPAAPAP